MQGRDSVLAGLNCGLPRFLWCSSLGYGLGRIKMKSNKQERFSKQSLLIKIEHEIVNLENKHNFVQSTGHSQISEDMKSGNLDRVLAFGHYQCLLEVFDNLNLDWKDVNFRW
jgi:hypothetical protein